MKTIDTLLKRGDLSALLQHDGMMQTAAGLIVPAASAEPFIKSEARKIAAEEDNKRKPYLFSQYALYQNMANWGARDKPRGSAALGDLQEAAKKSFIDAILIQARTDQNKMIWQRGVEGKQVGFKVVHERYDDPKFKPTEDVDRRCREMEEILSDPTPFKFKHLYPLKRQIHEGGLKDFISREVRAELIIDRKCMYRYKRRNGKGYAAFHWLPGESIKPVHEAIKEWASRNPDKSDPLRKITISQQTFDRMSATTGFDIANSDYVQIIDGQVTGAFTEDEISIHIANPSDEVNTFGWGYSRLEMSLDVTATLLYAWRYNQEIFKTNYPEQVLAITGNYDKQGLEAWKQQVLGEAGGPGNNWRLPIIASESGSEFGDGFDIKAFKLREAPKDMLFDQLFRMLISIKCASYGAHPSIVNFSVDSSGSSLMSHDPQSEIEFSKEHGFLPQLMDFCEWLSRAIVKPTYEDLKVIIIGLDDQSDKEKLDMVIAKVSKYVSRNDQLVAENLDPKGYWVSSEEYQKLSDEDKAKYDNNPWNYPADAPIATYITALGQKKMQEAMVNGDIEPGDADQGNNEQVKKDQDPIQKAIPEPPRDVKYLRITIDDVARTGI